MAHIEERAKFDFIRYANCWEDSRILCEALQSAPGKRFLSIASAGDNSLALLAGGAEVVAADLNQTQLACVELRREAIKHLSHADCLAFLGITASTKRNDVYHRLRDGLSKYAQNYWDLNQPLVADGFIHHGKFEKYFQFFRKWVISLVHSKKTIHELLREKPLDERLAFYDKVWDNRRWRLLFRLFFSKRVMGKMGRDPEFFRYVDVPVAESILKRTKYALSELETHDNPYLEYILTSQFKNALPDYLREENFAKIKANIDNLTIHQGQIQEVAEADGRGFDGFNLSDIFEYLSPEICTDLYERLLNQSRPGARLVYWNMLAPRSCPESLTDRVQRLDELAETLFKQDRAWFYSRFVIEEVL